MNTGCPLFLFLCLWSFKYKFCSCLPTTDVHCPFFFSNQLDLHYVWEVINQSMINWAFTSFVQSTSQGFLILIHSMLARPLGAIWGSVSCPRMLWNEDRRGWGSKTPTLWSVGYLLYLLSHSCPKTIEFSIISIRLGGYCSIQCQTGELARLEAKSSMSIN